MNKVSFVMFPVIAISLLASGCATSPEAETQRLAIEQEIDEILAIPLDEEEYGPKKRCLGANDYRDFKALDDRHILFRGRGDKLWINTLRSRCGDLRHGEVLIVRSGVSAGRLCELDRFEVADWFSRPWYRRWPTAGSWGTGRFCALGEFQPVTQMQVDLIKDALARE